MSQCVLGTAAPGPVAQVRWAGGRQRLRLVVVAGLGFGSTPQKTSGSSSSSKKVGLVCFV